MSFSARQTEDFLGAVMVYGTLDEAVSWIRDNICVDDVFRDDDIKEYCKGEFEVGDIFDEDQIKEYCELNVCIEDVATVETLTAWALENGFTKP